MAHNALRYRSARWGNRVLSHGAAPRPRLHPGVVESGHSCWGALRQDVWARSTVAMIACGIKALVRGEEVAPKAPAAPAQPPAALSRIVTVGTQALARALLQRVCKL